MKITREKRTKRKDKFSPERREFIKYVAALPALLAPGILLSKKKTGKIKVALEDLEELEEENEKKYWKDKTVIGPNFSTSIEVPGNENRPKLQVIAVLNNAYMTPKDAAAIAYGEKKIIKDLSPMKKHFPELKYVKLYVNDGDNLAVYVVPVGKEGEIEENSPVLVIECRGKKLKTSWGEIEY
ncbi:hypothetical protein JXB01_02675 [Candidatus Micrarchaeota archaeon]|nr:hypothetical protein [Candidatus Micrarchaeota archaeon]